MDYNNSDAFNKQRRALSYASIGDFQIVMKWTLKSGLGNGMYFA